METEIDRLNKMRERILSKSKENLIEVQEKISSHKNDLGDDSYKPMIFTIHPNEVEKLNTWMGNIMGVYGKYGNFEYTFKSTGGLGYDIWVYSDLANTEICLTENFDY